MGSEKGRGKLATLSLVLVSQLLLGSCGGSPPASTETGACAELSGTGWVPQVAGVTPSNHQNAVTITQEVIQTQGPVTGLNQAATSSREISVSIDMTEDLGAFGSLMLIGQVTSYPAILDGSAFALLVSLHDGTNEYINLARSGSSGDCAASGYFSCSQGLCTSNPSCAVQWPSAFFSRDHWEQRQGILFDTAVNYPSANLFPTCNWSGGSGNSASNPSCPFVTDDDLVNPPSTFFPSGTGRLRYGVNYTAKYVLLADSYLSVNSGTAGLKVTAIKKSSTQSAVGGAVDFNVILVGKDNVNASRTALGARDLNTVMTNVVEYLGQAGTDIKVGTIRAYEWTCGDEFTNVDISEIGDLFASSSTVVAPDTEGKAVNIFLVSTIEDSSIGNGLTILGLDGAIGAPPLHGTAVSGLAVSTFGQIGQLNPDCPNSATVCAKNQQSSSSFQLGDTLTHEIGHFFGLNHPSESSGTRHDFNPGTPICQATQTVGSSSYITARSCRINDTNTFPETGTKCSQDCITYDETQGIFCASQKSCQFNYIMWWTSRFFYEPSGTSDGTLFSAEDGNIMTYHPVVQ